MQGLHIPHSNTIIKTVTLNDWNLKSLYKFCNRKVATFFCCFRFVRTFPSYNAAYQKIYLYNIVNCKPPDNDLERLLLVEII